MATQPVETVYLKIAAVLFVGVLVAACARQEVKLHAVSYNKAISDFGNKQVLVNAVRASKRYPMYFSAVGQMDGEGMVDGSLAAKFPFTKRKVGGPGGRGSQWELNAFDLNPEANFRSGLTSVSIANLNTKEFQKQFFTEMSADTFQRFHDNDIPKSLLFNLFVHKIIIDRALDLELGHGRIRRCQDQRIEKPHRQQYACDQVDADLREYGTLPCKRAYRDPRTGNSQYFNDPDDECAFMRFRIFVGELRALGFFVETKQVSKAKYTPSERTDTHVAGEVDRVIPDKDTQDTGLRNIRKTVIVKKAKPAKSKATIQFSKKVKQGYIPSLLFGKPVFRFELRSPYAMIEYIGGLIRAQLFRPQEEKFTPRVPVGQRFRPVPLFVVREGALGASVNAVISVRHEGRVYYVPRPNYGKRDEARSLQVIDLINQVIALQVDQESLPKTSTIKLVN